MKFAVFLAITFAILKVNARPTNNIPEDIPDFLLELIQQAIKCGDEIGPNAEDLQNMPLQGILPEDNESFNLYFGCIWKKRGIINEEAEIDPDNLRVYLEGLFTMGEEVTPVVTSLVDSVMNECENVQGKDYGQKAVKINNCVLSQLYKIVENKK